MKILYKITHFILIVNTCFVYCNEVFPKDFISIQNQLSSDMFELKDGLSRVQISVEILNKRQLHQLNDLRELLSTCHTDVIGQQTAHNSEDACEEVSLYSNETLTKYNAFHESSILKLVELKKNQTQSLEELLKEKILKAKCPYVHPKDELLTAIEDKVEEFEQKLNEFEALEDKLNMKQKKSEDFNKNQINILNQIKQKLTENEQKFVKFLKEMPNLNNFSNKISNMANWRHWRHRSPPRQ